MRAPTSFIFLLLIILLTIDTTFACKCFVIHHEEHDKAKTNACCIEVRGKGDGADCLASSISNHLSNFHTCCRNKSSRSDCKCPKGCFETGE